MMTISEVGSRLTEQDAELLARRWIDAPTAQAAQLRRVDASEAQELLRDKQSRDCSGILIPYLPAAQTAAEEPPRSFRIRRDNPGQQDNVKPKRYVGPPESRSLLYFAPGFAEYLREPDLPVVLTTGELATLALARLARWDAAAEDAAAPPPAADLTAGEIGPFVDAMQVWHPGMDADFAAGLYRRAWEEYSCPPMCTFRFLEQFTTTAVRSPTKFYPKVFEQLPAWLRENSRQMETQLYLREQEQLRKASLPRPHFLPAGFGTNWLWRHEGKPIADLEQLYWKGRRVAIALHGDGEPVEEARKKLTQELQRRGALVGPLTWDAQVYQGAQGIEDLLGHGGPDITLRHYRSVQYRARQVTDRSNPFRVDQNQVLYVDPDSDKAPVRICGRLEVLAKSRDHDSEAWGRLLMWRDDDGIEHRWLCPAELLAGDGSEIRGRLASGGLHLSPGARSKQLLLSYLVNAQTDARITCTAQIGWHQHTFVLPRRAIGPNASEVMLQSLNAEAHLRTAGTLEQWQKHVATPSEGNSRLQLAIAAALAGPTLFLSGLESGGIHFCGTTSKGKTTALMVGGSTLGGGGKSGFLHSWHNTMNGLEAIAESHNDLTLFLDELGQVDAREAQETAYLLGNGSGKGRMHKSLAQRRKLTWSLIYVSAGETTLADHMASVGKTAKGGAEIRLLNIPADTGKHGLFEVLHGAPDAATFSRRIKEAALRYYGTALVPWLEYLTTHRDTAAKRLKAERQAAAKTMAVPAGASGELYRAAERMASIGAAGEMAIEAGVLPWAKGSSMAAAKTCYDAWRQLRGSAAATEEQAGLRRLRLFLEREGAARFQRTPKEKINNRAGFRREKKGDEPGEFLILPEVWKAEICHAQITPDALAQLCKEAGLLTKHDTGRWTSSERIPALDGGKARVYVISEEILDLE